MPESDRRSMILLRAAPLFAEKGINGCTVRGIADEVGMLSGSLYHHFSSKDDIVEAIVAEYLEVLAGRYQELLSGTEGRERIEALVLASIEVGVDNKYASQIYQSNRTYFASGKKFARIRRLAKQVHRTWTEAIDDGVRAGAFRADVDPRVFHRFLRDAVFLSSRWYEPSKAYSPARLAEDTTRVFLDGFMA